MTNEQADEIVGTREVPKELLRRLEGISYEAMVEVGGRLINQIIGMQAEYRNKHGSGPTHVIIDQAFYEAIVTCMYENDPDFEAKVNYMGKPTIGGMVVITTTRKNALELY